MLFIRNEEALKTSKRIICTEFQLDAYSKIFSNFDMGSYHFLQWDHDQRLRGGGRRLILRVSQSNEFMMSLIRNSSPNNYHVGGGIEFELTALASLFLRKRIDLGPYVRLNDTPSSNRLNQLYIDSQLIDGSARLQDMEDWFNKVRQLDPNLHQRFMLATRFYHQGVCIIEEYPDLAYLNFVSAIETVSGDFPVDGELWKINRPLSQSLENILDESLRNEIVDRILSRSFHGRRFVEFILQHTTDSFWTGENENEERTIRENFRSILIRIYKQRSDTLHSGSAFPPHIFHTPVHGMEMPSGASAVNHGYEVRIEDSIPCPQFFERLINHVLKKYLVRNQVIDKGDN